MKPVVGRVYYLKDYTAPKVFNGLFFECLQTDQKTRADEKIHKDLGLFTDWPHPVYKPGRFFKKISKNKKWGIPAKLFDSIK